MELKVYNQFEVFKESVLPFLEDQPVTNNLMLGIILNIERFLAVPPFMAVVVGDDGVCLVALRTPPHRLILAADGSQPEAVKLLIKYFAQESYSLPGVIGPQMLAECFADQWGQSFHQGIELQSHLRVYKLESVSWQGSVSGHMRLANVSDIEHVAKWVESYRQELKLLVNLTDAHTWAEDAIKRRQVYLWEADEKAVSMAATGSPARDGISVGSVYTPPPLRRQGYASALVAKLSAKMLEEGQQYCMLFADLLNPTTNKIYQNIGYRAVSDFKEINFYLTE